MKVLPRRSALRLSIRARLLLLQSFLIGALCIVSVVAWHALDAERHSGQVLAKLNRAQRAFLDADTMHDELQADAQAAQLLEAGNAAAAGEVLARLHEHSLRFETALKTLQEFDRDPDVALDFGNGFAHQRAYIGLANTMVATAIRDRSEGAALEPSFVRYFQVVEDTDDAMTARISTAVGAAENDAIRDASIGKLWIGVAAVLTALVAGTLMIVISTSIRSSLRQICEAARALATGNLSVRSDVASDDEVGDLAVALNKMADDLQHMVDQLLADANRDAFAAKLTQALEMAANEKDVHGIVRRAMPEIATDLPMELLMAESNRPKMARVAESSSAGAPACGVQTLSSCAAIRRGSPIVFGDSNALDACPRLRQRYEAPVSATCVPIGFMGKAMGVLHVVGAPHPAGSRQQAAQLSALGAQVGARIGSLRALERARHHAYTDALTGLNNRRALEPVVQELVANDTPYALVLADLDHFKALNDRHGHEAGDRALRLFADVLRRSIRDTDYAVRWGGEEFLLVLPGAAKEPIVAVVQKIRRDLAEAVLLADGAVFTASFGIADSTAVGTFDDIVRLADEALYEAKRAGRDRCSVGPAVMDADGGGRLAARLKPDQVESTGGRSRAARAEGG